MRRGRFRVSAAVAVAASLSGCDLPGRPTEAERTVRPDRVLDGALLFENNCRGCHGEPGRSAPVRDLGDPVFLAVIGESELRRVVSEGVAGPPMPVFSSANGGPLTEAQIAALAGSIFSRWATPKAFDGADLPPYSEAAARRAGALPGDAGRGHAVWMDYCAECHGANAEGGGGALDLDQGSFLALISDQGLRSIVIAGRPELGMPSWREHEGKPPLALQQISDVVAWLTSLRRPFPGRPHSGAAVAAGAQ